MLIVMMFEDFFEVFDKGVVGLVDIVVDVLKWIEEGGVDVVIFDVNLCGGEKSMVVVEVLVVKGVFFVFVIGGGDDGVVLEF